MNREQENEKLRGLLQKACELIEEQDLHIEAEMLPAGRVLVEEIKAALSRQAAPQPKQSGWEAVVVVGWLGGNGLHSEEKEATGAPFPLMTVAQHERIVASLTRPAQTEQQPAAYFKASGTIRVRMEFCVHEKWMIDEDTGANCMLVGGWSALYAAPIAQTEKPVNMPEGWSIELGFVVLDRDSRTVESKSHTPTIKVIFPPCDPLNSSAWDLRDEVARRIGSMLATPIMLAEEY